MWHLPSLPYIYSSVFLYLRHFFVPWMRRNSNLGRPKLSLHRLLSQTSNLERVEPIIWTRPERNFSRPVVNFLPNEAKKKHYHTNFKFISLVCRMWRSTFVPKAIFRRFIHLRQTDRTCWTIQTHSDELNLATKFGLSHKNWTFGLGLCLSKLWISLEKHWY